jgi:predicted Zn-dependent peptidase
MNPRITTLDTGLRVVTDCVDTVESISLGVWVGVGNRHEPAEQNGIAHLFEHMAFKGTERRSAAAIAEEIDAVGGYLNAYTSRETTAFYAKVLKDDAALAIDIIADIVQRATLDEQELARERAVVLQEIGQALDTPDDVIFDFFQAEAFPDQPLGRPVLGAPEIVRSLSRGALRDYVAAHYGGPRMVLAASGHLDHDAVVDLADKAFRDLAPAAAVEAPGARYGGGDFRQARDLEQVHLCLGFEGVGYHDEDFYAAAVLSTLLGGGMSSRLFQEIRERRGLVYSIYSFSQSYMDGGLFGVYAGTGEAETAELVAVLCDELARVAHDAGDEEVERARTQIRAQTLMGLESTTTRCEHLGQHLLVYGRPVPMEEVVAKLAAVDTAALRRVAGRILQRRPTVAALGPIDGLAPYDEIAGRLA